MSWPLYPSQVSSRLSLSPILLSLPSRLLPSFFPSYLLSFSFDPVTYTLFLKLFKNKVYPLWIQIFSILWAKKLLENILFIWHSLKSIFYANCFTKHLNRNLVKLILKISPLWHMATLRRRALQQLAEDHSIQGRGRIRIKAVWLKPCY